MFIVTFGRLSYADPPDWVDLSGKLELEQIAGKHLHDKPYLRLYFNAVVTTGMARDLLNLVVEGPECDSVWAVYQEEVNEQSDTDDEEMEARYLHSNEI